MSFFLLATSFSSAASDSTAGSESTAGSPNPQVLQVSTASPQHGEHSSPADRRRPNPRFLQVATASPQPGKDPSPAERLRPNPPTGTIPPADLAFLAEISRRQPFLAASTDPAREPQSLDRFFTRAIYEQLHGNDHFGYTHDEGFTWTGRRVTLERIHTLPETRLFHDALAASLGAALEDHGVAVTADAPVRLGLALVGVEYAATADTVPGVMLEVYFRHTATGRAFFWRVGIGSCAGLPAALVDALDLVVTLLLSLRHD